MDDWLTYHYDALAEDGAEDDPQAWAELEEVRSLLAEHGRRLGLRRD